MSANPPPSAPMLSPDHKWVWDGSQWQPIADPEDQARKSVFPAFEGATRDLPVPVADARPVPGPPPGDFAAPVPLNVARPSGRRSNRGQALPPLWRQSPTGLNKYLYGAAGAVVVLIGALLVTQFAGISLPWTSRSSGPAAPVTGGGQQLADRSDFARADTFFKGVLAPGMADLSDTIGPVERGCHGTLTVACSSTLGPADREIKKLVSAIDGAATSLPPCIAHPISKVRADASGMDYNIAHMQSAFDQNDSGSVLGYYLRLENGNRALQADVAAAQQVQQVDCDPTITGP